MTNGNKLTCDRHDTYNSNCNACNEANTLFKKDDIGKPMLSLIEPDFIEGVARVLTIGGKQYGLDNWKSIPIEEKRRYKDALLRHINEYMKGNILDDDTHESHLYHAACNLMFLDYLDRGRVQMACKTKSKSPKPKK